MVLGSAQVMLKIRVGAIRHLHHIANSRKSSRDFLRQFSAVFEQINLPIREAF